MSIIALDNGHCRMLPHYEVEHQDCSDNAIGVITSVLTGKIIARIIDGKRVAA